MPRRLPLFLIALIAGVLIAASPAGAHNSLTSSEPADGATLTEAPTALTLTFDKSVPLDTLTIELIGPDGVRTDLAGSTNAADAANVVLTPLPDLSTGTANLRWRLVGPDGHPITGRISFTVSSVAATAGDVAQSGPTTIVPPSGSSPLVPADAAGGRDAAFDEPWTTPEWARWTLRFGSYVAILVIGGVLTTSRFVWAEAWQHPRLTRWVARSLAVTLLFAVAQLLVIASDIRGRPPWSALGDVGAAIDTDAGFAFVLRTVVAIALAWTFRFAGNVGDSTRLHASAFLTLGLLFTWAFAGHSRSMRWPWLGVPIDVAHQAAASAWIGGLAILGVVAMREADVDELVDSVGRFARVAAASVAVIVVTGVVQSFRLVGSPDRLLSVGHGKFLLAKLLVLGVMLKVADVNRQRVLRRFRVDRRPGRRVIDNVRRAMGTEFVAGMFIVAVTSAMVVSPPAVAQQIDANATASASELEPTSAPVDNDTEGTTATTVETTTTAVRPLTANTITTTARPCVLSGNAPLQQGDANDDVRCLQRSLSAIGLYADAATGTFDSSTLAAVTSFQTDRGLEADGVVGRVTGSELGIWPPD